MTRSGWCRRCGEYDVWGKGCRCELRGRAWLAEDDEEEGSEIWPIYSDPDLSLEKWASRRNSDNCYEIFRDGEPRAVAFRATGAATVQYLKICMEIVPSYHVEKVEKGDDTVQGARADRARSLRWRRKRDLERRNLVVSAAGKEGE